MYIVGFCTAFDLLPCVLLCSIFVTLEENYVYTKFTKKLTPLAKRITFSPLNNLLYQCICLRRRTSGTHIEIQWSKNIVTSVSIAIKYLPLPGCQLTLFDNCSY